MIRFACPMCRAALTVARDEAGQKIACPHCGQRLQVPVPPDKTVLGEMLPPAAGGAPAAPAPPRVPGLVVVEVPPSATHPPPPREDVVDVLAVPETRRRRRDEDDEDDEDRPPRRRFRCPECGSTYPPVTRSEISQTGWILFVVLLLFFFPLCFLGLLMKDEYRACADCGVRLGRARQRFG